MKRIRLTGIAPWARGGGWRGAFGALAAISLRVEPIPMPQFDPVVAFLSCTRRTLRVLRAALPAFLRFGVAALKSCIPSRSAVCLFALVLLLPSSTDAQAQTAPEITSGGPFTVAEGTTAVTTLTASDEDTATDQLVWTIPEEGMGGADADQFTLGSAGDLAFSTAKDYENPDDADGDRTYEVTVQVSDGTSTSSPLDLSVTVTNVDEEGTITFFPAQPRVGTVLQVRVSDPDGVGKLTWKWASSMDKSGWDDINDFGEQITSEGERSEQPPGPNYAPTDADRGLYLRATATYRDGFGPGKTLKVVWDHVVGEQAPAPKITVVEIVSGLSHPWDIAFAPDGTMLFTERGGRRSPGRGRLLSRLTDGTVQTVSADLDDGYFVNDTGLTGIVIDPDFASNRRFYTCLAHTGPEGQVIAWSINDTYTEAVRVADPLVRGIRVGNAYHAGCRLRFGPEGYLWIATGDAYRPTLPQNLDSRGGKILRVEASTGARAPGNPFASQVYSYGHRHPQGLALRPGTNQMWSVEHGTGRDDEINLLATGGNYGWDPVDGLDDSWVPGYNHSAPMTDLAKFPDAKEAKWSSGNHTLATSGGIFLEGEDWGEWDGRLAVAALKTLLLRVFEFTTGGAFVSQVAVPAVDGAYGRLRTPMLGPDGALYVTTSNGRGRDKILRVSASRAPAFLTDTETRKVDENNDISTFVAKVLALDSDGDTLTYTLSGPDAASFSIPDDTVGAMWANVAFDYETRRSYEVTATATDPQGLNDSTILTITVMDTDEPPPAPSAPTVSAKAGTTDSLDVIWIAPANAGKPGIESYDLQYRKGDSGAWTNGPQDQTTTSATITGLEAGSSYHVQVRATNDEGDSPWSVAGTGQTITLQEAAPEITSATTFTVDEETTAVATLTATDADADPLMWSIPTAGGTDAAQFTLSSAGVLAFAAAPDYENPDDADGDRTYEITVQVSDGDNPVTADIRVTLQNVLELSTELTGPSSTDYAENGATRVATYMASSPEDNADVIWSLSGADSGGFSIDGGALRFLSLPDYESPSDVGTDNMYSVTVAASDGISNLTKDVTVTVTDRDEAGALTLSSTAPRLGTALTTAVTDPDGVTGTVRWTWERSAGRNTWEVIAGAAAAGYTPTAADTGAYLRATATYTDSHAPDQSASAVSAEVVTAELLSSLAVTTIASTAGHDKWAMRPEFSAGILHYAVGCLPPDTMTLAFSAAIAGTRVAVNGIQKAENATVEELVEGDSEVRITLTTGNGASTTYVVRCMDSGNPAIERAGKEPGATTELLSVYAQIEPVRLKFQR